MSTKLGNDARIEWIDYVKGLIIAYVVFRHVNDGLKWQGGEWKAATDTIIYWYHDKYPMAAFFFFSGLFVRRAVNRPFKGFLVNRLLTGVYPYVVWVILFNVLQVALNAHTNNPASFQPIREMLYNPPYQYWFLYALVLISVLWVGMRKLQVDSGTLLLIFTLLFIFQSSLRGMTWHGLHFVASQGVFFALGAYMGYDGAVQRFVQAPLLKLFAVAAVGFGVIAWTTPRGFQEPYIGLLILTLCTLPITFALGILLDRYNALPFIKRWGKLSLEIYVAHVFGTAGARIALQKFLGIEDLVIHTLVGMAAGIYLPIVLVVVLDRLHFPYLFRLEPRRVVRARAAVPGSAERPA